MCPEEFPPLYGRLHDRRPAIKAHYEKHVGMQVSTWNTLGKSRHTHDKITKETSSDIPKLTVLDNNPKFAVWKPQRNYHVEQSAWNDDGCVEGGTWSKPKALGRNGQPSLILDDTDYVAYHSWFQGNFGHFVHDHLPTIALLKAFVPPTTKFLLMETNVTKNVLTMLDPQFVKTRVVWIRYNQVVQIRGGHTLTVSTPNSMPAAGGCCRQFDYMRQWVAALHPDHHPDLTHERKKTVLYYKRGGSSDTHHGRVLDPNHETQIVRHIRDAMTKYNRPEEFAIFSGQWEGKTMEVVNQFAMFRTASAIIGPHGSGIGGNFIWTNPYVRNCKDRVKLLEFIPGEESKQVQVMYATYFMNWRKWPLEYHSLLYTKESTFDTTYINLQDLDDALDAMWGPHSNDYRGTNPDFTPTASSSSPEKR